MLNSPSDKNEFNKRVRLIQEWIIDDYPTQDIISQAMQLWGVTDRQSYRYLKEARKKWNSQADETIEQKRRLKIQSLKKLKRSLKDQYKGTPKGITAVLAVDKEIIKLENLRPAEKIEVTGKNGAPIETIEFRVNLTPDEIKKFSKSLEDEY
jgi:hypothetical protein